MAAWAYASTALPGGRAAPLGILFCVINKKEVRFALSLPYASIMSVVIKFSRPDSVHRCKLRVLRADYLPITLAGAHEASVVHRGKAVGTYDYGFRISAALEQLWIRSLRMDLLDCIGSSQLIPL